MKSDTELSDNSPRLTAHEITGSEPNDAQSLILTDRRRFLAGGLMGAAGLALASPLQKALALPGDPRLWTPEALFVPPARIRWRTIFTAVELVASLLGFRPFVMTVKELIDAFLPSKQEAANANQAQEQAQQQVKQAGFPHQAGSAPAGAPGTVGLYSVLAPGAAGLGLSSSLFQRVAHLRRAYRQRPRQFFYPALRDDGLNGITCNFDYDAGTYNAVGFLGGPTNYLLKETKARMQKWGYTTQEAINEALFPYRQQRISPGLFNKSYGPNDPDRYTTRQATATERAQIEVQYSYSRPGIGEGEVALFRLEDMVSRKLIPRIQRLRYAVTYERDESN